MIDTTEQIAHARAEKDRFFKSHPQSPLTPEQQRTFDGLNYFEPNPALDLELVPTPFERKENVRMMTSTNEIRSYVKWGTVKFAVDGEEATLTVFAVPGQGFFLPFTDATSGEESYDAGRYVEIEQLPDGKLHIDFNEAYNPYCAYSPMWSCPLVPSENHLGVPIRAGEKTPTGEWVGLTE
jgi:uncharacterized protein